MMIVMGLFSRSASQGVDTILYCAVGGSSELESKRGKFVRDRRIEQNVEKLLDDLKNQSDELWSVSEQTIETIMRNDEE